MSDVRVFDSIGRWVRTVDRQGAGPGEFEALGFVYRGPGDSVVTFEPGTQRLQRRTPAVEFRRLTTLISTFTGQDGFRHLRLHRFRSAPNDK